MFGAIVGAMLIVYAVLAVAMVIMLPLTIIARMRREPAGEVPILDDLEDDLARSRAEDLEEKRQLTLVRLQTTAEAAARSHDQVLEDWVTHLQDEQMTASPVGTASTAVPEDVDPAVQKRLLDALDAAQSDRVDPVDPGLDHYAVGLYATRVRELEAAWTAYRRAEGR